MKLGYGELTRTEVTEAMAKRILNLLIGAGITYQEAEDSLGLTQMLLATETRPSAAKTESTVSELADSVATEIAKGLAFVRIPES